MKKKKSISLIFIFLTFLSLAGSFSLNDFAKTNASPIETQTQLVEDADNILHEFRETAKLSVHEGSRNAGSEFMDYTILLTAIIHQRSNLIPSQQFLLKPSHKLFIDFRVLII